MLRRRLIGKSIVQISTSTGTETFEWNVDGLYRWRYVRDWTQAVFSDGSVGPKVYGSMYYHEDYATMMHYYGSWNYEQGFTTRYRAVYPVKQWQNYEPFDEWGDSYTEYDYSTHTSIVGEAWIYTYAGSYTVRNRYETPTYHFSDGSSKAGWRAMIQQSLVSIETIGLTDWTFYPTYKERTATYLYTWPEHEPLQTQHPYPFQEKIWF